MTDAPTHAGIAVQAADTGRVLLIQRALDPDDPPDVQGTWEFPGGSIEDGETPEQGAWREFREETGLPKPDGETVTSWTSPNGVYQGFVHLVPVEADAFDELNPDREAADTVNPDDPEHENPEVTAWFDPAHVRDLGPALRPEVADMDWSVFDRGNETTEAWASMAQEASMGDQDLALVETVTITEAAAAEARKTGEFPIQFISPGWGTSGHYSAQVLREAAAERVIPKGTHMYADHPTDAEAKARPARSIKDLMAVTTEDAHLSPDGALVGRAKVVPSWQPFVEAVAPHIGVSIRGEAKDIHEGVAEGRKGRIIAGLRPVASVDFVTRAGRGGRVLELLESAVSEGVDIREDLDRAVIEAKYDAEQKRALLAKGHAIKNENGDPSYPIDDEEDLANAIRAVGRGGTGHDKIRAYIRRRAKALGKSDAIPDTWGSDGSMSESDTTDVPTTRSDDKKEARMGMKEIEESEFTRLTEQAGRVTTLEAALSKTQGELTEAKAALLPNKDLRDRITTLVAENALLRATMAAGPLIGEALEDALIGEAAKKRITGELLEGITVKEGEPGQLATLDTAALTEAINAAVRVAEAEAQELREAMGVPAPGMPRGLGRVGGGLLVEQKLEEYTDTTAGALGKAFGLSEASAKTAAAGR